MESLQSHFKVIITVDEASMHALKKMMQSCKLLYITRTVHVVYYLEMF